MKDATGLFWEGLGAGPAGIRGQHAEELLPADTLPQGSAAALQQGLLARPLLWGASGSGASLGPPFLGRTLRVFPSLV